MKLFFLSKLRRREAREQALSNHVEYACCYLNEVTTALEKLFPKYSDITERYLHVESNEKKSDVKKDASDTYKFFDAALLRSGDTGI